jgi:hypothetical protein
MAAKHLPKFHRPTKCCLSQPSLPWTVTRAKWSRPLCLGALPLSDLEPLTSASVNQSGFARVRWFDG